MVFLADITNMTFTLKDLIMLLGILIPFVVGVAYLKWKQNHMETRLNKQEEKHDGFKSHIYNKLDESNNTLHNIELSMEKMKTEFLQTIINALPKK